RGRLHDGSLRHPLAHREPAASRSEEHTSELQSRLVISYAVFCLKKKKRMKIVWRFFVQILTQQYVIKRTSSLSSSLEKPAAQRSSTFARVFFFNDTATTEIYTTRHTLSLHDALPISSAGLSSRCGHRSSVCR